MDTKKYRFHPTWFDIMCLSRSMWVSFLWLDVRWSPLYSLIEYAVKVIHTYIHMLIVVAKTHSILSLDSNGDGDGDGVGVAIDITKLVSGETRRGWTIDSFAFASCAIGSLSLFSSAVNSSSKSSIRRARAMGLVDSDDECWMLNAIVSGEIRRGRTIHSFAFASCAIGSSALFSSISGQFNSILPPNRPFDERGLCDWLIDWLIDSDAESNK